MYRSREGLISGPTVRVPDHHKTSTGTAERFPKCLFPLESGSDHPKGTGSRLSRVIMLAILGTVTYVTRTRFLGFITFGPSGAPGLSPNHPRRQTGARRCGIIDLPWQQVPIRRLPPLLPPPNRHILPSQSYPTWPWRVRSIAMNPQVLPPISLQY